MSKQTEQDREIAARLVVAIIARLEPKKVLEVPADRYNVDVIEKLWPRVLKVVTETK